MNRTLVITVIALLFICLSAAYAGNESKIGTAGAQELLIPTSARGAALGGSIVANAYGVEAMYWNPAGVADIARSEAMFTHIPWIADINIEYAAIATHIEDFGALGISAKIVNVGDIEETTEDFEAGTGRVFSPTLAVVGLSYARAMTSYINFGATAKYIREDIFEVSSSGFAFDFGFTYEPGWRGVRLGIVMKNWGPRMRFSGRGFERTYEEAGRPTSSQGAKFELPTSMNLGLSYEFLNRDLHTVTASGNFRANNQSTDYWQGGLEYGYDNWLFLRGGYKYSNQEGYIYGASLGGGITRPIGDLQLTIEYTWWETDVFDANQFFTVKAAF